MTRVLVTGANGFVGRTLCSTLQRSGFEVIAVVRHSRDIVSDNGIQYVVIDAINGNTDWSSILKDVDKIVHLAARVHVMRETLADPLAAFREVNVAGTRNLAEQAAAKGVKRFVFMSSIKVLGETGLQLKFDANTLEAPEDDYAVSKWEAEQALQVIAETNAMQIVVLRPPLIYGAGVKGNFFRLINLIRLGVPLPFASVRNRRTLLFIENCCELIELTLTHPNAGGRTLLMGDPEPLSIAQLIHYLASGLGVRVTLFSVSYAILKRLAGLMGKKADIERLCDSLEVDISSTCSLLDWQPAFSSKDGIEMTAKSFSGQKN